MARMRVPFVVLQRRLTAAVAVSLLAIAAPAPSAANPAFGLTAANEISTFDLSDPANLQSLLPITGLEPGEIGLAIDVRPATGQLYLLGSASRLYTLNPVTGVATPVGTAFSPALSGTRFAFDFNPVVDRIRVISDTGQNVRLHPDTGLVTVDVALSPGTPHVVTVAYDHNVAGASATTLYGIDSTTDQLVTIANPNTGIVTVVGPLGVDAGDASSFDISANDGIAYAMLQLGLGGTSLFVVDLTTGAVSPYQMVPGSPYRGFAVLARGVPMLALRGGGTTLARFHSATPGLIQASFPITGLQAGETIVDIDRRPADGQLYGVGSTSRLYLLDPMTGAATAVGSPFSPALSGTRFGIDFDPVEDRLRIVSDAEQNLRIHPDTGAVSDVDSPLNPTGTVVGAAYANNVDGATSARLFVIEAGLDQVLWQWSPSNGTLLFRGGLQVDTGIDAGFDVSPLDNVAFAALSVGGLSRLYTVSLAGGLASPVGTIGDGSAVNGLVAMPLVYHFAEGSTGSFFDTDLLVLNAGDGLTPVTITYLTEAGRVVVDGLDVPSETRRTISADANARLGATAFSSTVTSPLGLPLAVERTMRWDASGYGMHTEKAAASLARTWFFAEGAQGFYQTYFLLTNPSPAPNTATVRFLREDATQVTRTYMLGPQSRLTIYAGEIPELVNRSFGTVVSFAFAGAAERAMYFGTPVFNGGHESAGVTRPSTEWFLAEGATGSFFTTFVLVSNPQPTPANVTFTYLQEGGGTIARVRTMAANSRLTVNVALEDPALATGSVATRITSDQPIVAERAMYWPFAPSQWQEAHNAFGLTATANDWAMAEGRTGGAARFQTFVLIANPGDTEAFVNVWFERENGGVAVYKPQVVPPRARLTITTGPGSMVPELVNESFGVRLRSSVPIFAERALYSDANGIVFAAGSAATATVIP